jgi:hypothetical protein
MQKNEKKMTMAVDRSGMWWYINTPFGGNKPKTKRRTAVKTKALPSAN